MTETEARIAKRRTPRMRALAYREVGPLCARWREEGLSLRAIAKRLNDRGYRTRQGKFFTQTQVMRILNYDGIDTSIPGRAE